MGRRVTPPLLNPAFPATLLMLRGTANPVPGAADMADVAKSAPLDIAVAPFSTRRAYDRAWPFLCSRSTLLNRRPVIHVYCLRHYVRSSVADASRQTAVARRRLSFEWNRIRKSKPNLLGRLLGE